MDAKHAIEAPTRLSEINATVGNTSFDFLNIRIDIPTEY